MPGDQYEPNRVLGFPVRSGPHAQPGRAAAGTEPQRVAGLPLDWFSGDGLGSLARPVQEFRRWLRRRLHRPPAGGD